MNPILAGTCEVIAHSKNQPFLNKGVLGSQTVMQRRSWQSEKKKKNQNKMKRKPKKKEGVGEREE